MMVIEILGAQAGASREALAAGASIIGMFDNAATTRYATASPGGRPGAHETSGGINETTARAVAETSRSDDLHPGLSLTRRPLSTSSLKDLHRGISPAVARARSSRIRDPGDLYAPHPRHRHAHCENAHNPIAPGPLGKAPEMAPAPPTELPGNRPLHRIE